MTMGEYIKYLRKHNHLTQDELGKKLDPPVNRAAINKWESGQVKNIKRSHIEQMAHLFHVRPSALMCFDQDVNSEITTDESLKSITTQKVPFLNDTDYTKPTISNEERESYVEAGTHIKCDFCLRAHGDSMTGARINDGDIIFIQKRTTVENGDIAAVMIDDETTLKKVSYYPEKNLLILKSENPEYDDLIYTGEELNHVHILGKAVAFQSDVV